MSEYPIPEDLKIDYEAWKKHRTARYDIKEWMNCACSLIERIAKQDAEIERLNKMRTHCENCGADYMATGIEAGCPCKLAVENTSLKAQVERLENILRGNTREDTAEKIFAATAGAMNTRSVHILADEIFAARAEKEKP